MRVVDPSQAGQRRCASMTSAAMCAPGTVVGPASASLGTDESPYSAVGSPPRPGWSEQRSLMTVSVIRWRKKRPLAELKNRLDYVLPDESIKRVMERSRAAVLVEAACESVETPNKARVPCKRLRPLGVSQKAATAVAALSHFRRA